MAVWCKIVPLLIPEAEYSAPFKTIVYFTVKRLTRSAMLDIHAYKPRRTQDHHKQQLPSEPFNDASSCLSTALMALPGLQRGSKRFE